MKRVIRRYELTDEEWERLRKYFPERQPGTLGRPRKDSRDILNGIFWIARSGAAWRDLPERYGPWQTVYKRFAEWQKSGLIEKIFHELGEDADLEDISIDSTYIKAHKASAGAERGGGGSVGAAEAPRFMLSWMLLATPSMFSFLLGTCMT